MKRGGGGGGENSFSPRYLISHLFRLHSLTKHDLSCLGGGLLSAIHKFADGEGDEKEQLAVIDGGSGGKR